MQFELLRLSALPVQSLFKRRKDDNQEFTREEWIKDVFSREITFLHYKEEFFYVPDTDPERRLKSPTLIIGRIGRKISIKENMPPEEGLQDIQGEIWRAALTMIDPTAHEDGQKAAVQVDPAVGKALPMFESLAAQLSQRDEPFALEVNAITDTETFWEFVRTHRGDITSVTFRFVAPNMFSDKDDWDQEMRGMRDRERARRVKLQLESPDGLELETDRVKSAVAYTARGTGSVTARTRSKQRFNSANKGSKLVIPDGLSVADMLHWLVDKVFTK